MKNRIVCGIVAFIVLASALTGCNTAATSESSLMYGNQIGNKAYDFSLPDLDDNFVSLSSFQGHPVVLNFWSTA